MKKTGYKTALSFWILCLFFSVFYLWIAANVPYTGDDWDWGLDIGLQHLLTADINSRYAGNFLVVVMTRSPLAKTLLMGAAFTALPLVLALAAEDAGLEKPSARTAVMYLAANILLLSMNRQIWQQTYGWVSGFANYGFSALLAALCILAALPLFRQVPPRFSRCPALWAVMFAMGLVIQLFLENLAVFMVLFAAGLCVICRIRLRKTDGRYIALLLGCLAGLALMFSSSIYPALFSTGSTLENGRTLTFEAGTGPVGTLVSCLNVFCRDLCPEIWENNTVICCGISLLLSLLWLKRNGPMTFIQVLSLAVNMICIGYFIVFSHLEYGKYLLIRYAPVDFWETLANLGFFLSVTVQTVLLYRQRRWHMWKLLLIWLSAPGVILPLSAATVEGSRFYLTSSLFLIFFALLLLEDLLQDLNPAGLRAVLAVGLCAALCLCLYYFFIYLDIAACTRQRMELFELARSGAVQELELPAYPYLSRDYVWWGEPGNDQRTVWFKEFFRIPQEIRLTFFLK